MIERVVYNSEESLWYKDGEESHRLEVVNNEASGKRVVTPHVSASADTYPEAFEKIFGHALVIPPPVRAPRREAVLA